MINKENISKKFLSNGLLETYDVTTAYVAKVGFIPSIIREEFQKEFLGEDKSFEKQAKEYIKDTYNLIDASPYVMDVKPSYEEYMKCFEEAEPSVSVYRMQSTISMDFINLRTVMPRRKREKLGLFMSSWSPETFNIAFDGSLFLTYAAIDKIPVYTDLGQIAKNYLKGLMDGSKVIDPFDGAGPTPIHPEIYIVKLKAKSNSGIDEKNEIPCVNYPEGKVVILIPDENDISQVLDQLLRDMQLSISSFYGQRLMNRVLLLQINAFEEMSEALSGELEEYFELTLVQRFFSGTPKKIRSLLALMHLCLQRITSSQFQTKRKRDEALKYINSSTFFSGLESYFDDHMKDKHDFDRDFQLTSMDFASNETGKSVLTQTALVAALSGALTSGIITAVTQYLAGSNGG